MIKFKGPQRKRRSLKADRVTKFNPYHGPDGRFTTASRATFVSLSSAHGTQLARMRSEGSQTSIRAGYSKGYLFDRRGDNRLGPERGGITRLSRGPELRSRNFRGSGLSTAERATLRSKDREVTRPRIRELEFTRGERWTQTDRILARRRAQRNVDQRRAERRAELRAQLSAERRATGVGVQGNLDLQGGGKTKPRRNLMDAIQAEQTRQREMSIPERNRQVAALGSKGIMVAGDVASGWNDSAIGKKVSIEEFAQGVLGDTAPGANRRVTINKIRGGLEVRGTGDMFGGKDIDTLERQFTVDGNGNIGVYNAFFRAKNGAGGRGAAKAMMKSNLELHKKLGVKEVRVSAGLNAGGYVWAKMGFESADPQGFASTVNFQLTSIENTLRNPPDFQADRVSQSERDSALREVATLKNAVSTMGDAGNPKVSRVFAEMGSTTKSLNTALNKLYQDTPDYGGTSLSNTVAKRVLAGSSWSGKIDLTGDSKESREQLRYIESQTGARLLDT